MRVGTALVNMYAKCGSIKDARLAFDKMSKRNVISCTAMIVGYAQHGHCEEAFEVYRQMQQVGMKPDRITYMSVLNACDSATALEHGREVHAHIIGAGLQSDVRVGTALVSMFAKCGSMRDAQVVFDNMDKRHVISWTALIEGYAHHGQCEEAFEVFCRMQQVGLKPNHITYLSILSACASPGDLERGKEVHGYIIDAGFQSDVCVSNAIVSMYAKCGSISIARLVFDEMSKRNVISWTAMIGGYAQHGHCEEAFEVFCQMQRVGMKPDRITYMSILNACASCPTALEHGKEVHAHVIDAGFQCDVYVGNALINMYAKCGSLSDAWIVFDKIGKPNVWSWNAMIGGYAQDGLCEEAFEVYCQMQQRGLKPDQITYTSVLNTWSNPAALDFGKEVHAHIVDSGIQIDVYVGHALINMYAKCGSIRDAQLVFDEMAKQDSITWNAMIAGYAQHDHCEEAFDVFL